MKPGREPVAEDERVFVLTLIWWKNGRNHVLGWISAGTALVCSPFPLPLQRYLTTLKVFIIDFLFQLENNLSHRFYSVTPTNLKINDCGWIFYPKYAESKHAPPPPPCAADLPYFHILSIKMDEGPGSKKCAFLEMASRGQLLWC